MRFSIDVVGVARDGQVVSIARDVPPWRISLSWRAFAIVELRAGRSHDVGLQIGARLEARQRHPSPDPPMLGPRIL